LEFEIWNLESGVSTALPECANCAQSLIESGPMLAGGRNAMNRLRTWRLAALVIVLGN